MTPRWYLFSVLTRAHVFADPHEVIAFYDSLRNVSSTVEEFHETRIGANQVLLG
jgi:hypothetical protein